MHIFYADDFVLPLPEGHRFPMRKYAKLRERVAMLAPDALRRPAAATDAELALAHDADYVLAVTRGTLGEDACRRIGFPWSPQMAERARRSVGATIGACRSALASGFGINLAGGTHHADAGHGAGFCVFNDAVVAARVMQRDAGIERIAIVDLDVHQGEGTASMLAGDRDVFTFSMHGRNNFPFRKAASRLDIELDDGTGDAAYLCALELALPLVVERGRPQLAIYLAGADPYAGDRLGRLSLSKEGLALRDRRVLSTLASAHVPVAVAMAGGYAENVDDIVDIHFETVRIVLELARSSD